MLKLLIRPFMFSFAIFCSASFQAIGQPSELPWLKNIGAREKVTTLHTISADAVVTVSDGLTYTTNTVFHDRQRAVFHRVYTDRTVTQAVEGRYFWAYDGSVEKEAPAFVEKFVMGHQFHAQILFFDRLHRVAGEPKAAQFSGENCMALAAEDDDSKWWLYYNSAGRPMGMETTGKDVTLTIRFDDWRNVSGVQLPFLVWIDDGNRQFGYRYSSVRLNEGSLSGFRAPEEVLTEEQKLLRLHRIVMDDHWFGIAAGLKTLRHDSLVIVSDGNIYTMSGKESDAMMDRILASRDYTVYDDLDRPTVTISEDGTLGWVIARVSAKGQRLDAGGTPTGPLEFVSAWIELYKKINGQWRLVGNVSNFDPARK